jgi:hypothetical protein
MSSPSPSIFEPVPVEEPTFTFTLSSSISKSLIPIIAVSTTNPTKWSLSEDTVKLISPGASATFEISIDGGTLYVPILGGNAQPAYGAIHLVVNNPSKNIVTAASGNLTFNATSGLFNIGNIKATTTSGTSSNVITAKPRSLSTKCQSCATCSGNCNVPFGNLCIGTCGAAPSSTKCTVDSDCNTFQCSSNSAQPYPVCDSGACACSATKPSVETPCNSVSDCMNFPCPNGQPVACNSTSSLCYCAVPTLSTTSTTFPTWAIVLISSIVGFIVFVAVVVLIARSQT